MVYKIHNTHTHTRTHSSQTHRQQKNDIIYNITCCIISHFVRNRQMSLVVFCNEKKNTHTNSTVRIVHTLPYRIEPLVVAKRALVGVENDDSYYVDERNGNGRR